MKRFFKCFTKDPPAVSTLNPIVTSTFFPPHLQSLPDTLAELLYLETIIHLNLKSFNQEATILSEKANIYIIRGDMYKGMFVLKQRRYVVEESSKLLQVLDDLKEKKKYLEDVPAEFRAARKLRL